MNSNGKMVVSGLGALLFTLTAPAVTPPEKAAEYAVIGNRNPFGLVDPPPPPVKVEEVVKKEAEPPPNVELTGLFHNSRKGKTVAMFLVEKKKGDKKESFMWSVGEGDEGMKVLAINEVEKTVRLKVQNLESTITFSEKKAAAPVAAPAVGGPRVPGQPGQPTRNPRTAAMTEPEVQQIESMRRAGLGRSASTMSAVGGALPTRSAAAQANALTPVSPRTLRVPGATTSQGNQPDVQTLTPREQEVLIEVNREVLRQTGQINIMPPLPPTSLTTPEDRAVIIAPPSPGGYPQHQ